MSNRSYPADFSRPLREVPVATDEDVARMLERLRRRCKVGKVSVNGSVAQGSEQAPVEREVAGSIPAGTANLAPASSAGHPSPAGPLVVSGTAGITATAGGGPHETGCDSSLPFQPTRPAPLVWERVNPTAMRTICGTWTCCKVVVRGLPQYELWRKIAGVERPIRLPRAYESFLKAQETAQAEMDVD